MTRFDVAVIGGGIAGTSVAWFLSSRASVVVLEAESTLGVHSTGRSAAVFTECYGEPVVRRLAIASRSFMEDPPDGFTEDRLVAPRGILFAVTPDQASRVEATLVEQQALVPSVRRVTTDEARAMCPVLNTDVAGGVYEPKALDIDVHALHTGYQRGVRRNGGEVLRDRRVDSITKRSGGWSIRAGGEEIDAEIVVDAAGAWGDMVAELAGVPPLGLMPTRRSVFTFDPPPGVDHRGWPMVIDFDEQYYFKPEGPSLLASPADEAPVPPGDVRPEETDVAMGIDRINRATTLGVRSVRTTWAGLRSFVADRSPVNGWDDTVTGFYWLVGQGGFGIKTSPAMGRYAAEIIDGGDPLEDDLTRGLDPALLGVTRLRR